MNFTPSRFIRHGSAWLFLYLVAGLMTVLVQPGSISLTDWFSYFTGTDNQALSIILFEFRIPRVVNALVSGGALAVSGLLLQLTLRNPLAEPYILGISSGASLGAVLPLAFGIQIYFVQAGFALAGSAIGTVLVFWIGTRYGSLDPGRLLLGGVMTSAALSAVLFLVLNLTGDSLRIAISWLMGNLGLASPLITWTVSPLLALLALAMIRFAFQFNLLLTGEAVAAQSGVNVERLKRLTYICVSALTGLTVSISGIIGFVGLVVPHFLRIFYGNDHRYLIPFSFLAGGILLVFSDWIARTLVYPTELPVGAITALIGAPWFIYLLRNKT